jgi:hypothetical protein
MVNPSGGVEIQLSGFAYETNHNNSRNENFNCSPSGDFAEGVCLWLGVLHAADSTPKDHGPRQWFLV